MILSFIFFQKHKLLLNNFLFLKDENLISLKLCNWSEKYENMNIEESNLDL